ncbi:myosin heavy chain 95F-like isoform X1 [Daphnia pulex]|uniref:myosin heavy chain 95F-like isoform X1 n=2 Tax=Daphnia pulex TaxID=6669 RepID=UPI001EDEC60D|nr:myosin heavy chain 95F-like isoform X1 [Daphnia pulex]
MAAKGCKIQESSSAPENAPVTPKVMMDNQKVWVPDVHRGFILGKIVDLGSEAITVLPIEQGLKEIRCPYDRVYPAGEDDNKDVDDNCSLMFLNEATFLNNVALRYKRDQIYTYVANILIAVNPYFEIKGLYSKDAIKKYQGKSLGTLPPHVFAVVDKAFRDMRVLKQSQSIVVSGESGAGKTESTKYILRYLCESGGLSAGPIEQQILDANPLLEAFGNAKTTRNNNSSRFGKFIEIHFTSKYTIAGGFISHYLLEKSRIVTQSKEERNYHFFYQLCAGASEKLKGQLQLRSPDHFHYLSQGCTQYFLSKGSDSSIDPNRKSKEHRSRGSLNDPLLDDANDFKQTDKALSNLGMSDDEKLAIYSAVAAILHLGNITFEDNAEDARGGCQIAKSSHEALRNASALIGVDPEELHHALLSRVMQPSKGGIKGTVIMVPLKVFEASNARDALAKAIYSRLFDYIVHRINQSIPFQSSMHYVGVLDIAGFEYFTVNSFEQFCINYCNEKLQQFFNERILKEEQLLYDKEGLGVKKIVYVDNQDCIDLIEARTSGIFYLLDEESKLPKSNHTHFTSTVHSANPNHFRLALPRKSKLRDHREIRDDEGFLIRHFAGAVCYQTAKFIEKNNDALHASLECIIQESHNPFLKSLFVASTSNSSQQWKGKLSFISVGSKFRMQLNELMEKLRSTGTNFIRCVKPNLKMVDHLFEGGQILSQLQCSGMTSVLELMQQGYPSRAPFVDLYNIYKSILPPQLARLDPRLFCRSLFQALNLNDHDFKFGLTKVFFRPGKFSEFDTLMRSDSDHLRQLVNLVRQWLLKSRWKKAQWCALSVIKLKNKILYRAQQLIIIQKTVRMHLARKKYRPRIVGLRQVRALQQSVKQSEKIVHMLKDKQSSVQQMQKLQADMENAARSFKENERIAEKEINMVVVRLEHQADDLMKTLKAKVEQQKSAEEQEKLRKIQEEMARERRRKEEEEKRRLEEEDNRRKRAEMEIKRKAEEETRKRQEEDDRRAAEQLQAELERNGVNQTRLLEQLEQERRDHELALRLAQETNGQVDDADLSSQLRRSDVVMLQRAAYAGKKYDLSKWKYSELRDTINTSCDIELLEACREEFHRRLKVYHAWKARNKKRTAVMDENQRVPQAVLDAASKPVLRPRTSVMVPSDAQRFFRIPFVKPNADSSAPADKKGYWYAHFDGQWIARQMELHPDKPPVLLVAGLDDMQMCELSLDETGLTRKRGAEILEHEFVREWEKAGGATYVRPADRNRKAAITPAK